MVSWMDTDWRKWKFPKKVPKRMKSLWEYAESIRKDHPEIWKKGGNIQGNDSYKELTKIVKRGEFRESDREFIKMWQAWMARHRQDFRLAGVIANLKWLSIVDKGLPHMKKVIKDSIK